MLHVEILAQTTVATGERSRSDLAARSKVYDYSAGLHRDGTLVRISPLGGSQLCQMPRGSVTTKASPPAAIIDAQSIKSAEMGGAHIDPNGYDAGKQVKGKERHVLVDTEGMLLHTIVTCC